MNLIYLSLCQTPHRKTVKGSIDDLFDVRQEHQPSYWVDAYYCLMIINEQGKISRKI